LYEVSQALRQSHAANRVISRHPNSRLALEPPGSSSCWTNGYDKA
jgi:hypothetical protein